MITEIDNYRGWKIYFDTDKETFFAEADEYDARATKRSYAAVKTWIDAYLKDNQEFKPFKITQNPSKSSGRVILTVIGIRKDGRFVYQDDKGDKKQISDWYEKDYMLYNSDNDELDERMQTLAGQIKDLYKQQEELVKQYKVKPLPEVKRERYADFLKK